MSIPYCKLCTVHIKGEYEALSILFTKNIAALGLKHVILYCTSFNTVNRRVATTYIKFKFRIFSCLQNT